MLSERIKELREARGVSQVETAKALGVTKQSVSNWENDNIQPSIDMLIRLSEFFSVSTDYLLGITKEDTIDVTGLPVEMAAHVRLLVEDLRQKQ